MSSHFPRKNGQPLFSPLPTVIFSAKPCGPMSTNRPHPDRCLQTSQPTAQALALPLYVEHGSPS